MLTLWPAPKFSTGYEWNEKSKCGLSRENYTKALNLRVGSAADWGKFDLQIDSVADHGALLIGTLALVRSVPPPLNSLQHQWLIALDHACSSKIK